MMERFAIGVAVWFGFAGIVLAQAPTPDGHWKFQDDTGSTTILATLATNGVWENSGNTSASTTTGPGAPLTKALLCDGVNDYAGLNVGNTSLSRNKSGFTASIWAKPQNGMSASQTLFKVNNPLGHERFEMHLSNAGVFVASANPEDGVAGSTKTSTAEFDNGAWHCFCAVYDIAGDSITLYVDGAAVASTGTVSFAVTATSDTASTFTSAGIGDWGAFNGPISGLRVYSSARSAGDVSAIFAADVTPASGSVAKILQLLSDYRSHQQLHLATYGVYSIR